MKVILEFPGSHHYVQEYSLCDGMFCPNCGKMDGIWVEESPGDYYCGPTHVCKYCSNSFTIQGPSLPNIPYIRLADQILEGVPLIPSTRKA